MLAEQARKTSAALGLSSKTSAKQVFDGNELVTLLPRLDKRHMQADEVLGQSCDFGIALMIDCIRFI